ncbi:hypothetical protein CC99x_007585 [Candidatus Berkiella cookevillensis]|nr:hypothetical protein [Candidatus Berkiella cookevillensis]MCS5708764.1 hypothetical protein [Candidatus Berkiella cookevillensis]
MKTIKKLSIATLIAFFSINCFADEVDLSQKSTQTLKESDKQLEESLNREAKIQELVKENDLLSDKQKQKAKNEQKERARNEILKTNCTRAKSRLEDLMTNERILIQSKQGKTHALSQKEKLDEIQSTEIAIKKYCTN